MSHEVVLLTLDTDAVGFLLFGRERHTEAMDGLFGLHTTGVVDLAVALDLMAQEWGRRGDADLINSRVQAVRAARLTEIGTVARWDVRAVWGVHVFGKDPAEFEAPVTAIMRPSGFDPADPRFERQVSDIDHLLAHDLAARHVLVTGNTNDFTPYRCRRLQEEVGVLVMTPPEALAYATT